MNEGMAVFLNIDPEKPRESEELIRRIDRLLLKHGIRYSGIRNLYSPIDQRKRDHGIYNARHVLRETLWLKDRLAYISILHQTNVCSLEQIRLDHMLEPSPGKLKYYEDFYQASYSLAHGIVVDQDRQLRDGYISYILARKYGLQPDIYEAFANEPLRKIVRGRHVVPAGDTWRIKTEKLYTWGYDLRRAVIPGDILEVRTKLGSAFICVDRIDYVTGQEFCGEYSEVMRHLGKRLKSTPPR